MTARRSSDSGGMAGAVAFAGRPSRLRLQDPAGLPIDGRTRVELPAELATHAAGDSALRLHRDPARVRLKLDRSTPPGTYRATLRDAEGNARDITVAVEPRRRLRVRPNALRLQGDPGSVVSATLMVTNRGNVAVDIADTQVTGLFDDDGIEAALASAYRQQSGDVNAIVGHLFERLREAHGGLLKLRVVEGAGPLAPGDGRAVRFETRLAEKLRAGHAYHGMLAFAGHDISVEVQVGATA